MHAKINCLRKWNILKHLKTQKVCTNKLFKNINYKNNACRNDFVCCFKNIYIKKKKKKCMHKRTVPNKTS